MAGLRGQCTARPTEAHEKALRDRKAKSATVLQGLRRRGLAAFGGYGRDHEGIDVPLTPLGRWVRALMCQLDRWRREAEGQAREANRWKRRAMKAATEAAKLQRELARRDAA